MILNAVSVYIVHLITRSPSTGAEKFIIKKVARSLNVAYYRPTDTMVYTRLLAFNVLEREGGGVRASMHKKEMTCTLPPFPLNPEVA